MAVLTDTWLAASVEVHEGRTQRFGPDEINADDILLGANWSTQIPGGFHDGSITIPRDPELSAMEAKRYLLAPVEIYGPDGTAYVGRVASVPSVGVDVIELQLEGNVALLEDDKSLRPFYVSRDLSAWTSASLTRKDEMYTATFNVVTDPSIDDDGWLKLLFNPEANAEAMCEAYLDLGAGNTVSSISYEYSSIAIAGFTGSIGASSDRLRSAESATSDLITGTNSAGSGTLTPTAAYRYAFITFWVGTGAHTTGGDDHYMAVKPAVFGNPGLTKRGTAPDEGHYASDIITNVVGRCAPALPIDEIEESTFVIQQATWLEPTTGREIIEEMTALGGGQSLVNDWGVYDDTGGFFWRTPGTYGKIWRVRQDETHEPQDEGPTAVGRCNGVVVRFQDPAGTQFTVGPVGSGSDYESSDLEDTDPDNPYNRAGVRGWVTIDAGLALGPDADPSEHARIIGRLALLEANADHRRGSVLVKHEARDSAYNTFPAHRIRAGDRIVVEDDLEDTTERRVISTSYDMASDTCTASIGTVPDRLDALLARLAIVNQVGGF